MLEVGNWENISEEFQEKQSAGCGPARLIVCSCNGAFQKRKRAEKEKRNEKEEKIREDKRREEG